MDSTSSHVITVWDRPRTVASPAISTRVSQKLAKFESFQDGWAFGAGRAFDKTVILKARTLAAIGHFDAVDVFPGRHGQITVSYYRGSHQIDLAISPDAILLTVEKDDVVIEEDREVSLLDSLALLTKPDERTAWGSYYCSLSMISKAKSGAFEVKLSSHSRNPTKILPVEYQYSTATAHLVFPNANARTLTDSTVLPSHSPQGGFIFGTSILPGFLRHQQSSQR